MRIRLLLMAPSAAILLALGLGAAPVQFDDGPSRMAGGDNTLRVDVRLVSVVATVTDAEGRYVSGLQAEDFVIEDNGFPQQIVHFSHDRDIPVSVGVAIDTSASMAERIRTALSAVAGFVRTLHEDDDVFFVTFSDRASLIQDLTSDRWKLTRALGEVRTMGGTALYDALATSVERVAKGRHDKRAILILTDGTDTSSDLDLQETLEKLRSSEVLVYGLGIDPFRFGDPSEHVAFELPGSIIPGGRVAPRNASNEQPADMGVLRSFAAASGGKSYRVAGTWTGDTADDIDSVLAEVAAELRAQYTLGYYPSTDPDGRFHQIKIRVPEHDYTVRARNGYRSSDE